MKSPWQYLYMLLQHLSLSIPNDTVNSLKGHLQFIRALFTVCSLQKADTFVRGTRGPNIQEGDKNWLYQNCRDFPKIVYQRTFNAFPAYKLKLYFRIYRT